MQFNELDEKKVREIYSKYGKAIGVSDEIDKHVQSNMDKNYCILVFLENVRRIKPFNINKKGFGNMCAWISIDKLNKIRI